jgi:hypothetical protein
MSRDPGLARQLWRRIEVIHAVTYFSPEPLNALRDAGYKGFWMGYFAGRAAPFGEASADIVMATFYNFAESRVRKAVPDAWSFAPPSAALDARLVGSVGAIRRAIGDADVADVAALARRAAESAPVDGRALFAANAGLVWPDEPLAVLWHALTLLREHRGDGHVAALVAAGIAGREAHVLHHPAPVGPPPAIMVVGRDFDDAEWTATVASVAERGLITEQGELTEAGRVVKQDIEDRTDRAALSAYAVLSDDEMQELIDGLTPIAKAVIATGDFPPVTPIGPIASGDDF